MSTQVSLRLTYPDAAALLNMMGVDDTREYVDRAHAKPDNDIPVGNHKGIVVRYFSLNQNFTVTFR